MKLTESEAARINDKLAKVRKVTCMTFDYAKTFELWENNGMKVRYRSLAEAKRNAAAFKKRNPERDIRVIEVKKRVHEFNVREVTP